MILFNRCDSNLCFFAFAGLGNFKRKEPVFDSGFSAQQKYRGWTPVFFIEQRSM